MLLKILLLIGVIGAVYALFLKKKKVESRGDEQTMVPCKECGLYVSSDEGVVADGNHYCSLECAKKGAR